MAKFIAPKTNNINYGMAVDNIRNALRAYILKHGTKALVLGVSGGIDSATCAALAWRVCEELNIPLIGQSITIVGNKENEINRARLIGSIFCTDFFEFDLTEDFRDRIKSIAKRRDASILDDSIKSKIRRGNLKARMRMEELYDTAQEKGGLVLSTDNLTEYFTGFWTLHGDVGDFGMIQNLWKGEVYNLAKWIVDNEFDAETTEGVNAMNALKLCIDGTPTDGLGITNSDLEQLGVKDYQEADDKLKEYFKYQLLIENPWNPDDDAKLAMREAENHPIIKRHLASEFKRNNPYNIPREEILKKAA